MNIDNDKMAYWEMGLVRSTIMEKVRQEMGIMVSKESK